MAAAPPPWPVAALRRLRRLVPRRRHLRGTFLHSVLGERLFDARLWRPRADRVAAGIAVGTFIALTPTVGLHFVLAGLAAFALRVNVPAALAACLVTNPLTAPILYPLEYRLGIAITGPVPEGAVEGEGLSGAVQVVLRHAKPLWAGSLVFAVAGAAVSHALSLAVARGLRGLRERREARRRERREEGPLPQIPPAGGAASSEARP